MDHNIKMTLKEYTELDLNLFFDLNNVSRKQLTRIIRYNNIDNYYISHCCCLMHKYKTKLYNHFDCIVLEQQSKDEYDELMSNYSDDSF